MTTGDSRRRRALVVPVMASASRSPSRSGASQRSASSVRSGAPNVSATGPGPNTGPLARASSPTAVIGRLWSSTTRPSTSIAHSTSCGPPNVAAARRASVTRRRRVRRARSAPGTSAAGVASRPLVVSVRCTPSTSPLTSRSGPPGTAATTSRSRRPVTGSAPNRTPPQAGSRNGWTSTAIGAPRLDPITSSTAARNASHPRTSSTLRKSPAIDCDPPSSTVDDDRTTSGRAPCSDSAAHAECSAVAWRRDVRPAATASAPAVVSTKPGSAGSRAARARASAAAFAPATSRSRAMSSSRSTTGGTRSAIGRTHVVVTVARRPSERTATRRRAPRRCRAPHVPRWWSWPSRASFVQSPPTTGVVVKRLGDRELIPPGTCDPSHPRAEAVAMTRSSHTHDSIERHVRLYIGEAPVSRARDHPWSGAGRPSPSAGYDRGAMPTDAPVLVTRPVDHAAPAECLHCSPPLTPAGVFVGRTPALVALAVLFVALAVAALVDHGALLLTWDEPIQRAVESNRSAFSRHALPADLVPRLDEDRARAGHRPDRRHVATLSRPRRRGAGGDAEPAVARVHVEVRRRP